MKKRYWNSIKIIIGFILVAYLIWHVDVSAMWVEVKEGQVLWLLPAIFCILLLLLLLAPLKLWPLLKGRNDLSFATLYKASLIGLFFNNVLPSSVGGDAVKIAILKKNSNARWAELVAASLMDRFIGLGLMLLAGAIYLLWNPRNEAMNMIRGFNASLNTSYVLITILAVIFFLIVFRKKWTGFFIQMLRSISSYSLTSVSMALSIALIFQLFRLHALSFYLRFYHFSLPPEDLLFVLSVVTLISVIPLSIGALGVRENAMAWSLSLYGIPLGIGVGVALLSRFVFVIISLFGSYYYFKDLRSVNISKA